MYKLNFITVVSIIAAFSVVLGTASPIAVAAFAAQHENMTMNMGNNMSSMMGNMTGGGNATSMAGNMTESENLTTAGETAFFK
jgi:Spy/CpxP family protein refolding chaperone